MRYTLSADSYAGYYTVSAHTLWRDVETGADHACVITIPKAKLQSNLSLSMAPNGDPAAFTFTFDAFAVAGDYAHFDIADDAAVKDLTTVVLAYYDATNKVAKQETKTLAGGNSLSITSGTIKLSNGTSSEDQDFTRKLADTEFVTDFNTILDFNSGSKTIDVGGTTYLHII